MNPKPWLLGCAAVALALDLSVAGLALVHEFLGRGAQVAFVARGAERVERVARDHPGAHGIVGDISIKEDIHPSLFKSSASWAAGMCW